MASRLREFVVKASQASEDWSWEADYFSRCDDDKNVHWTTESARSRKTMREYLEVGDLALCYQCDDKKIYGLTQLMSGGRPGSRGEFDVCPPDKAFKLTRPLSIHELRKSGCDPECFRRGFGHGTVHLIGRHEFERIIDVILRYSPSDAEELRSWLSNAGWARRYLS